MNKAQLLILSSLLMTSLGWAKTSPPKKTAQYCGFSAQDLSAHPLDPSIRKLIQENCGKETTEISRILREATKGLSPSETQAFVTHLSESHPDAQKRLFDHITSMKPEVLRGLIQKIAQLKCAESTK